MGGGPSSGSSASNSYSGPSSGSSASHGYGAPSGGSSASHGYGAPSGGSSASNSYGAPSGGSSASNSYNGSSSGGSLGSSFSGYNSPSSGGGQSCSQVPRQNCQSVSVQVPREQRKRRQILICKFLGVEVEVDDLPIMGEACVEVLETIFICKNLFHLTRNYLTNPLNI